MAAPSNYRLPSKAQECDSRRAFLRAKWGPTLASAIQDAHNRGELCAIVPAPGYLCPTNYHSEVKVVIDGLLSERGYKLYSVDGCAGHERLTISWAEPVERRESDQDNPLPFATVLAAAVSEDAARLYGPDLAKSMPKEPATKREFFIRGEGIFVHSAPRLQSGRLRVYMFLLKQAGHSASFCSSEDGDYIHVYDT